MADAVAAGDERHEAIRRRPGLREIEICYHPGNEGSRRRYTRHGFVEQGQDADGEDMLAVLTL